MFIVKRDFKRNQLHIVSHPSQIAPSESRSVLQNHIRYFSTAVGFKPEKHITKRGNNPEIYQIEFNIRQYAIYF